MTITCQKEFADACEFAAAADRMLESEIELETDDAKDCKLAEKRGQACRSLLHCFGCLAKWDSDYNNLGRADTFKPDTKIVRQDGIPLTVGENPPSDRLPRKETFVFADIAPHSFFFREMFVDPDTRQPVRVFDQLYYVFKDVRSRGITQEYVDALTDDGLLMDAMKGECVLEMTDPKSVVAGSIVRHIEKERHGLCGGIIWHPDYVDGKPTRYGHWSIHT